MRVLIVGRNESDAARLARAVRDAGHTPTWDCRGADAIVTTRPGLARFYAEAPADRTPTVLPARIFLEGNDG